VSRKRVVAGKKRGTEPPRKGRGEGGGDPVRATGGDHAGTGSRGTPKRPRRTAKEKRLTTIKKRAERWNKARWKEVGTDIIEDKAQLADLTEAVHIEDWVSDLRREGFTDFYAHPIKKGPTLRPGLRPEGVAPAGQPG
jgi:hypothetical protein